MKYSLSTFALSALLMAAGNTGLFAQQHDHGGMMMASDSTTNTGGNVALKVGKKGDIILEQDTQAGDLLLKAGAYKVQHRIEGDRHVLHFTSESDVHENGHTVWPARNWSGDARCSLEPLNSKVENTEVATDKTAGGWRLVKVEIGGENVAHVL